MSRLTNCVNCGAVLLDNKCENCGTEYARPTRVLKIGGVDYAPIFADAEHPGLSLDGFGGGGCGGNGRGHNGVIIIFDDGGTE